MNIKKHSKEPGYIAERKNPFITSEKVVIYYADKQGIDVGENKYAVVCNAHGTIIGTTNIPKARSLMKYPEFCEECMELIKQ